MKTSKITDEQIGLLLRQGGEGRQPTGRDPRRCSPWAPQQRREIVVLL